jgi:ribosomal protein S19
MQGEDKGADNSQLQIAYSIHEHLPRWVGQVVGTHPSEEGKNFRQIYCQEEDLGRYLLMAQQRAEMGA